MIFLLIVQVGGPFSAFPAEQVHRSSVSIVYSSAWARAWQAWDKGLLDRSHGLCGNVSGDAPASRYGPPERAGRHSHARSVGMIKNTKAWRTSRIHSRGGNGSYIQPRPPTHVANPRDGVMLHQVWAQSETFMQSFTLRDLRDHTGDGCATPRRASSRSSPSRPAGVRRGAFRRGVCRGAA